MKHSSPHIIRVQAHFAALSELRKFVTNVAHDAGLNDHECGELSLAVDEAASNIIKHALSNAESELSCACQVDQNSRTIRCELTYAAPIQPPSVSPSRAEIESRITALKRGGLGIYLMHSLVDTVEYDIRNGQNIICLIKMHRE